MHAASLLGSFDLGDVEVEEEDELLVDMVKDEEEDLFGLVLEEDPDMYAAAGIPTNFIACLFVQCTQYMYLLVL